MMQAIRSRRIARGGYTSGSEERVTTVWLESNAGAQEVETVEIPQFDFEFELSQRVEAARDEAFEAGYRRGVSDGRKETASEAQLLRRLIDDIAGGVDVVWETCRAGTASLAMQIARRVVGASADHHEQIAHDLAKRAVVLAREQTKITIYVNPSDADALRKAEMDILAAAEGVRTIEIGAKGSIPPGGVVIECELGSFDLRAEVQLEALELALDDDIGQAG